MRKNRLNTVYASDSIQQERLPVSLDLSIIKPIYVKASFAKEANKLQIACFEINIIYTYVTQIICDGIHFW